MNKYEVTIRATICKTIIVDAENQNEAYAEAHDLFSTDIDEWPERYEQEVIEIGQI